MSYELLCEHVTLLDAVRAGNVRYNQIIGCIVLMYG